MIQHNIRRRILIPLGIAIIALSGIGIISFHLHADRALAQETAQQAETADRIFRNVLDTDAELISELINGLQSNNCLQQAFAEGHRKKLLYCATPIFEELRKEHRITHFYFHGTDQINFLRIHSPARHGDYIDRFTMRQAVETGVPSHGIELGPYGTFTLRVVHPWRLGNRLIGYLELGEEIEHIAPQISKALGVDLIMAIEKRFLNKEQWEEGLRMMGKTGDWDLMPNLAIIDSTFGYWTPQLKAFFTADFQAHKQDSLNTGQPAHLHTSPALTLEGRRYNGHGMALFDAASQQLGHTLILSDTTDENNRINQTTLLVAGSALTISILLFGLFGLYLGRIQLTLNHTQTQLEHKLEEHQQAESTLRQNESRLAREIAQRGKAVAEEHALTTLLRLCLAPLPMQEFLQGCINTLVESVPWLKLLPKGSIFLTEEEGQGKRLILSAQYNLSSEVQCLCAQVDFGTCLCGLTAATGETQFADCVDHRHTILYEGMPPHGHFSVPIRHEQTVLGVLLLYIPHGYEPVGDETSFLERATSVLSMGILRRYHEDQLRLAKDQAVAASMAKSEFLATMSHEIRTPMNGILGMAELLVDTPLTEEQQEYVDIVRQSGKNLMLIINDILDLSKIEAEQMVLAPIAFDLELIAHEAMQLVAPRANDKELELLFHYSPDCPRHLKGDAGRIRQILLNLLGNAIKFTEQGHILVEITGTQTSKDSAEILISVQDSGIGINPAKQSVLFEPFVQADASTTRKYGGTGLGLAISKRLVDLMGGEIGIKSNNGEGSTFWIKLPLPLDSPPQPLPQHRLEQAHTLLIDQGRLSQQILSNQLTSLGLKVETATSQEQALEMLENARQSTNPFELALFKHPMSGVNTRELAEAIRAQDTTRQLPLILLSASAQRGDARYFEQAGFTAYLALPFMLNNLNQVISSTLATLDEMEADTERPLITSHSVAESVQATHRNTRFNAHVLLAEDNRINQKLTLTILNSLGVQAESAVDGEGAIQQWEQGDYDLIFMDCQMPTLDGYEATRIIRRREDSNGDHIPIIALTANAMSHDRERCMAAGMDDYITKPFKTEEIIQALARWLPKDKQIPVAEKS